MSNPISNPATTIFAFGIGATLGCATSVFTMELTKNKVCKILEGSTNLSSTSKKIIGFASGAMIWNICLDLADYLFPLESSRVFTGYKVGSMAFQILIASFAGIKSQTEPLPNNRNHANALFAALLSSSCVAHALYPAGAFVSTGASGLTGFLTSRWITRPLPQNVTLAHAE